MRLDAPVVSAVADGASARFVTLLAPRAPASGAALALDATGGVRVEIDGARDTSTSAGCELGARGRCGCAVELA